MDTFLGHHTNVITLASTLSTYIIASFLLL